MFRLIRTFVFVCPALFVHSPASGGAGDWPQWRHDAGRTSVTPHELPADLHLQWMRELADPRPAWPKSQTKLQFDVSYEPVVMGRTIFVPSMVRDSVTAYDTESGREKWRFYAEGPVRFAPIAHEGRVYFVSDDGYLYCLRAKHGALLWKFRGGPSERKLIGNDQLISMWPARGGPVLYDGKIYFAASIWPFMGIFIHALDAETGDVVWTNSGSGSIYILQQHDSPAFAGVAPQGYLAATEDKLLVSGGRTVPAAYDRETGELDYFHLSSRQFSNNAGGYVVTALPEWFFNGGAMYNLQDGKGLMATHGDLFCSNLMYSRKDGLLVCEHLPPIEVEVIDNRGNKQKKLEFKQLWKASLDPAADRILLKAGDRLYGSSHDGTVMAIDLATGGTAAVSWWTKVEGAPWSMLAANGKLFVVTEDGRLYCFGARKGEAKDYPKSEGSLPVTNDRWAQMAREILSRTQVTEGYCLGLGVESGRLIENLFRQSKLHVIATDPDADKVRAWRERLYDLAEIPPPPGQGRRISVLHGDAASLDLPPYLASLIVLEDFAAARQVGARRLFEWLRPYGGVACLSVAEAEQGNFEGWVAEAKLENADVGRAGRFGLLRRVGAMPGSGEWTHQYADSGNSVVSKDNRVRAPLGLLWFGGPANDEVLPRHGHGPSPQVVGGRLFIEGRHMLRAVDVYTGRLLWESKFEDLGKFYDNTSHQPGAGEIGSNYVSVRDGIYVMTPRSCVRLDPRTGEKVKQFTVPALNGREPPRWGFVSVLENLLIAAVSPVSVPESGNEAEQRPPQHMEIIIDKHAKWQYLVAAHPKGKWAQPDFRAEAWKTGSAGFGYGDNDDTTILDDMPGRYTAVYVRASFYVENVADIGKMMLTIRYDDAFIAYLNGHEIVRSGVGKGRGEVASEIASHEAAGFESFEIDNLGDLLRNGSNILAVEGHNVDVNSSDFSLDPYLAVEWKDTATRKQAGGVKVALEEVPDFRVDTDYASASRALVVMDRHTGNVLWSRRAKYSFRHNAVVAGAQKVFCIDGMSQAKMDLLQRRGLAPDTKPVLYALNARTGTIVWQTDENIFGTWLSYSTERDVLLQAGSRGPDRAHDESGHSMVAYRGEDGSVLWQDLAVEYSGPCMLHHDTIITQSSAFDLFTGKPRVRRHPLTGEEIAWSYIRNYGCNTVIGSEHLLTFRSAAAGYFDLEHIGGTGNLGGFKTGCTSNLIVADGVLNAPDYTRTCTCSYQNQASLALIHMPEMEMWTFCDLKMNDKPVRRVGINLGAPGDRLADNGTLWLDYPSRGGPSPDIPVLVEPTTKVVQKDEDGNEPTTHVSAVRTLRFHASRIQGGNLNWVASSALADLSGVTIELAQGENGDRPYTVGLYFAELENMRASQRVFSVRLQDQDVLRDFDIVKDAGAPNRCVVKQFEQVSIRDVLKVGFARAAGSDGGPLLCGIEIIAEDQ